MKDYGDSDPAQDTHQHWRLHQKSEEVVHWLNLNFGLNGKTPDTHNRCR